MAGQMDILIAHGRIIDPGQGLDGEGFVLLSGGRIQAVSLGDVPPEGSEGATVLDASGCWVVPGLLDLRANLREPGHEQAETIATGLAAAAAGGFTAVCITPDTDPILETAAVARLVQAKAEAASGARLYPVGAATEGLADEGLAPIGELVEAGCVAVTRGEVPVQGARLMRRVLEYTSTFGVPVIASSVDRSLEGSCDEGPWSTRLGLPATPAVAEHIAVARDLALAELTGSRLHLTRISTAGAVDQIREARRRGAPVTCDVAAHHLWFTAEALATFDPAFKVWPPFRSPSDRDALRAGLVDGTIDAVVSDHQPHRGQDKAMEFPRAATGASGLETALSAVVGLVREGHLAPTEAVARLSTGPRAVIDRPLSLAEGEVADLTVIDPEASWVPGPASLRSKGVHTPFGGATLHGRAKWTLVRGEIVWQLEVRV